MGDLVNLRQARKRKQRDQKAKQADQNRILYGRTRHERVLTDQERKNAQKAHDGHQRVDVKDPSPADGEGEMDESEVVPVAHDDQKVEPAQSNVVSIFPPNSSQD